MPHQKFSVFPEGNKKKRAWVKSFIDLSMLMAKIYNLIFSICWNGYAKGVSHLSS